jgi:hypothetical protein
LRVGVSDAEFLAKQFAPSFDSDDLQRIPNGNAAVRTLINGVPTQPFSMAGLPPVEIKNRELGEALKQLTAAKYSRPKAIVAKEITERISNVPVATASPANTGVQAPQKPATGSSFLDDWLQKKQTNSFKTPTSPFNKTAPQAQPAPAPIGQMQPTYQQQPVQQSVPIAQPQQTMPSYVPAQQNYQVQAQAQMPPQQPQNQPETPTQTTRQDSANHTVDLHNSQADDHTLKLR